MRILRINEYYYHLKGSDDFVQKNHTHDDIELIQVIRGNGTVLKSDELFPLQSQYLYIINAQRPHIVHPTNCEEYVRNKIVIDAKSFYSFFSEIGLENEMENLFLCPPISTVNNHRIDQIFKMVSSLCASGKKENLAFAHGYISEILHFVFSSTESTTISEKASTTIQGILNVITEKDGVSTLSEISAILHLNKYYLCHLFKEKTGITLSAYLAEKKYEKIVTLLTGTSYTLEEIALTCGFTSASSLTRFFKNKTGMCPKDYRKSTMSK